jgi:hypothetical protein
MSGEMIDFTRRQALAVASGITLIPRDPAPSWAAQSRSALEQNAVVATPDRLELARLDIADAAQTIFLAERGREGVFLFDRSDHSAKVAFDRHQGIYIAPAAEPSGAGGAWIRRFDGPVELGWFGMSPQAPGNADRLESAIALITTPTSGGEFRLPLGRLPFDRTVSIKRGCIIRGHGSTAEGPGTVCIFPAGASASQRAGIERARTTLSTSRFAT